MMTTRRSDISVCSCRSSRDNLLDFPVLKEILPSGYKYNVCNWISVNDDHFESRFRVNVTSYSQADLWLKEFSAAINTDFKKEKDLPDCEEAIIFYLRCKHVTKEPLRNCEKIDFLACKDNICPTRLVIILKLPTFAERYGSCGNVHLHEFPMTVIYHQCHNHPPEIQANLPKLPAINEQIENCLEAVEVQLQKSATGSSEVENLHVGSTTDLFFRPESKSYHEVMDCLFPAKSVEEETDFLLPPENNLFNFEVDSGSLIDYYRAYCKDNAADIFAQSDKTWLKTERYYEPVDMKILPHNSLQGIINQALKRIEDLEENEKNSNNI